MQEFSPATPFRRGAVEPVVCLKKGYDLIREQYWLFVGMSFVAILLGSLVPFGILLGPMMCGIYLSIFGLRHGQRAEFGQLFKGFDYFGESVIAALIQYVPIILILIPFYVVIYAGMFLITLRGGGEPDQGSVFGFIALVVVMFFVMMILILVITVIFTFSFSLIVDRRMSGIEAAKLSAKAARANFWPLLGLVLLNGLLQMLGALLCYVGVFLAWPVAFAAISVAHEQVFGLGEVQAPNLPPPPPTFT